MPLIEWRVGGVTVCESSVRLAAAHFFAGESTSVSKLENGLSDSLKQVGVRPGRDLPQMQAHKTPGWRWEVSAGCRGLRA